MHPCISVLRSMPGRVEDMALGRPPGMCPASSPPIPMPRRVVDGGMKSTAMIHFRASTALYQQTSEAVDEYQAYMNEKEMTNHFDGDLGLEEVDVLGKVESVLPTVPDHVGVQHIVSTFEDSRQVSQVWGTLQRKLQHSNQQVDNLESSIDLHTESINRFSVVFTKCSLWHEMIMLLKL